MNLEYGITNRIAIDATLGYSQAGVEGESDRGGLTDSRIGVSYNFATEGTDWNGPTLSLRGGAIIAGNYTEGELDSIGDGASGWEVSLLAEKEFGLGFGFYGDFGYRQRADDVPDSLFGNAGLYYSMGSWLVTAGYRFDDSLSGGDIGGAGFGTSFGLPQVEEDDYSIDASLGYTDPGGRFYSLFASHTIDGRNTGEKNFLGFSITLPFGGNNKAAPVGGKTPVSYSGK